MSQASQPFDFSQFVPGFDFLKSLAGGAANGGGAVPGMPSLASWVAPTMSVEEVDKRIQELKTVQYWLEQNGHALKATIQALEVQKMTLSTLRGMNVRMEDIAGAFARQAAAVAPTPAPAPAAAPGPEAGHGEAQPEEAPATRAKVRGKPAATADGAAGMVDPLKWWGSLTEQFQQIASTALQDAAQLKMPSVAQPLAGAVGQAMGTAPASRKSTPRKTPAKKKAASSSAAAARKRAAGRH